MSDQSAYEPARRPRNSKHHVRGVAYHVTEWGDDGDPLLVYLHGWGDTGSTFQFVVDAFAGDWHIVAPDWRGFGRSENHAHAYWFPDYLADLDRLLQEYSPAAPVRLIGHSMGGNVGGLYAGVMPERVSAFVDIEGFGLKDSDPSAAPANYRAWIERGRDIAAFSAFADRDALARHVRQRNPRMSMAQARFVADAWAEAGDAGMRLRADPAHRLPNAVLYRRAEAEACWRNVSAAVLLVAGAESRILEVLGEFAGAGSLDLPFPDCRRQLIAAAGHMLHFEAPQALAAVIEEFLGRFL